MNFLVYADAIARIGALVHRFYHYKIRVRSLRGKAGYIALAAVCVSICVQKVLRALRRRLRVVESIGIDISVNRFPAELYKGGVSHSVA